MASAADRRRNNVRAGVFVSISILIAVAVIVVLSGVWESLSTPTHGFTVAYPVSAGVSNLEAGAQVRMISNACSLAPSPMSRGDTIGSVMPALR